jgi:membrane associated rhomboid family serine protease
MAYSTRSYARPYLSGQLPRGLRMLLIVNVAVFLLQWATQGTRLDEVFSLLALQPIAVVRLFFVWQLVTYMFLHGGLWHILFNMLTLWMFGRELESTWGTRRFLQFYFFCGIGAGFFVVIANYLFGDPRVSTIGASGAIYGVLLASAVLWPDRIIYFNFLFPIKMKWLVAIYGAIAFLGSFNPHSGVSDVAHLSGMLFGYLFLKMPTVHGFHPLESVQHRYKAYKLARAKKRFQVYLRKQRSDRDPWVQ